MRALGPLLLLLVAIPALPGVAGDDAQVDWVGDWEEAFKLAKKTGRPVMVCINSKDGEQANERAAKEIYHDPWFVPLSRRFVMIVVSTREHDKDGVCPRFGKVTCERHLDCWKALRADHGDRFLLPGTTDEMISPQHAWFRPDGTLLQRKEYELFKPELLKLMRSILVAVEGNSGPVRDAPLTDRDRAELERLRRGDKESRWAALGNLIATGKTAVHAALADVAKSTKNKALQRDLLRALGRAQVPGMRPFVERFLKDPDADVRSFAAVCLEDMGDGGAVPALLRRARSEPVSTVRKNLYRALGACGGPAASKGAAKALLKAVSDDKQKMVRKHAALALRSYAGEGAKLVLKKLELAALRTKDRDVQQAMVYALAYLGNEKTTVRVLEKILEKTREDWKQSFVRDAIKKLKGEKGHFSASWLFYEDRDDPARKDERSK